MAEDTPLNYRNLVLYELFVRNQGPHGSFADVTADLPRIREMGVDILWLMPVHPIGFVNRQSKWGSPYGILDYTAINSEFGTKTDFFMLINRAHELGLKVMMDIVFNHIAKDSPLVREHPDWFHQDAQGHIISRVPEWPEVFDFKFPNDSLEAYLIEILQGWAAFGVDAFRCDVASFMPQDFWIKARHEVGRVKPGIIWLGENPHARNIELRRSKGLQAFSDCEVYQAFDITYDNDIWSAWRAVLAGKSNLSKYLEMLRFQDCIYPTNFIKMRCVENHDRARFTTLVSPPEKRLAWTAFQAFNKGAFLIYAGQESAEEHGHFDGDRIEWNNFPLQPFLTKLAHMKKDPILTKGCFMLTGAEPVVQATWYTSTECLYGLFNLQGSQGKIELPVPDGDYTNILDGNLLNVSRRKADIPASAAIFRYPADGLPKPFYSDLLDFDSTEYLPKA
jgi:hypothetical protein